MKQLTRLFTTNPIIAHAVRTRRLNWRLLAALGLALLAYCPAFAIFSPFLLTGLINDENFLTFLLDNLPDIGQILFYATASFLLVLVTLFAPTMSASAIAGERQRQTLDLLLITLLPVRSIINGKLVSALLYTLFLIAVVWPVIIFSLLTGGVALTILAAGVLILVVTAVAFTAIGLFVSSLGRTTTNAVMLTYGLALPALFIAPPLLMLVISIGLNLIDPGLSIDRIVNFYGWSLVASLNPISAAIYSASIYNEGRGSLFLNTITTGSKTFYLLSPWLLYIIFYTVGAWFLTRLTVNRLERLSD